MKCGRALVSDERGLVEGEAVKVDHHLSFLGEVDPKAGTLYDGRSIKDKVLVIKGVRGSTVGSYVIYALKYYNNAPRAIVVESEADPIVVAGCVMAGIPLVDKVGDVDVRDGEHLLINFSGNEACLTVVPRPKNCWQKSP